MNILILGANGFIGSHLIEAIFHKTQWQVYGMDLKHDKLTDYINDDRFHFKLGDITQEKKWLDEHIQQCDVVLPLVAIATPALYVQDPIRVFELDFEANLEIVRACLHHQKRIIFPSTSEVYGMCDDAEFDEQKSFLVTGPIHKERWIYATSKQLLDRLIYAYGKHHGLSYTLFRPFNWYGPRLDNIHNPQPGGSRVLTQFIGNIIRGQNIKLVDGGLQQRCFTYIEDGIEGLLRIIENKNNCATNKIFNLGNPQQNISIQKLAEMLLDFIAKYFPKYAEQANQVQVMKTDAKSYYGEGYQDVLMRIPSIRNAQEFLNWEPKVDIGLGLKKTLDYYLV